MTQLGGFTEDLIQTTRQAFAEQGPFAKALATFIPRPAQQHLAETIAEVILSSTHLVAEAGTGTGKTFAYLVPSLLSGKKVLISTATKMLQDQLVTKDLPELMRIFRLGVRVQNLKGRANYLCEHRIKLFSEEARFVERSTAHTLMLIRKKLVQLKEGVREELPEIAEDSPVWPFATSTADNCLGTKCTFYQSCFLVKARRRAMDADLVVINHHLFFADAKLKEEAFGALLPGVQIVVFDEAHQLPDIATDFFGHRLSTRMLSLWGNELEKVWPTTSPQQVKILDSLTLLERILGQLKLLCKAETRFHLEKNMRQPGFQVSWEELKRTLALFRDYFIDEGVTEQGEDNQELQQCYVRLQGFLAFFEKLEGLLSSAPSYIAWGETHKQHVVFSLTPIQVASQFSQVLNNLKAAVIWTSATLTVAGQFDIFLQSLGIQQAKTLFLPSPFDFVNQALLYLPRGLPDPRHDTYYSSLINHLVPLIEALKGRCFFLFTSHEALNLVAERLPMQVSYPVLVQGCESKSILLARFRELGNAILLGTATFWEGVDVKGEALSCVIIDKIPFMNPTDPITQAKIAYFSQLGQSGFEVYSLPAAVIALKQGVGRLIRGDEDRGIIVIADPRLTSRKYGEVIFKSLPEFQRTREWEKVLAFAESLGT